MRKPKRYKGVSAEFKREAILRVAEKGVTAFKNPQQKC